MKRKQTAANGRVRRFILLAVLIVLGILLVLFIPWNAWALSSNPDPVQSYEEATQRIEAMRADRLSEMNPDCLPQLMTHGNTVEHVIILVHGYTSCPAQFGALGQQFHDLGYNVLIAPLPHHGLADRMTDEQNQLTAKELTEYADEVVDIAHGLGSRSA